MHRRFLVGVTMALIGGLLALPAIASADHADGHMGVTKAKVVTATLTGTGEAPVNDSTAAGMIRITVDRDKHLLCYELVATGIEIAAGHIHKAPAGSNGEVVLDLNSFGQPLDEVSSGCTAEVRKGLLRGLANNPHRFYVNLHTAKFPGGEIRGQLSGS